MDMIVVDFLARWSTFCLVLLDWIALLFPLFKRNTLKRQKIRRESMRFLNWFLGLYGIFVGRPC